MYSNMISLVLKRRAEGQKEAQVYQMSIKKVPNILTVIRALLVPVFMVIIIFTPLATDNQNLITGAVFFAVISLTDMIDGKIARKYDAVTDFGKFLDPIADKLLVIGGMISLCVFYLERDYIALPVFIAFSVFIVVARELAVTSLRLICKSSDGKVIAANMAGKIKTVSQMIFVVAACLEPVFFTDSLVISFVSLSVMTVMTVYSGINYFVIYIPLIRKGDNASE